MAKRSKLVNLVRQFHTARDLTIDAEYSEEEMHRRIRLITEEVEEFAGACYDIAGLDPEKTTGMSHLKEHILHEMVDVVYVVLGTAVAFGWDFDEAFARVHAANMSKTDEQIDGKIVKPEDFEAADMTGLCDPV